MIALLLISGSGFGFAQGSSQIQIINPHPETDKDPAGPELSLKPDGTDSAYHLNAWVPQPPTSPSVRWLLGNGTTTTVLGVSTTPIATNNFELKVMALPADGDYTLTAELYSGAPPASPATTPPPISSDTMPVQVNDKGPDPATQDLNTRAETVEITFPANGAALGYFIHNDGTTTVVIKGTASANTRFVKGLYTVSPVGSEPTWEDCGPYEAAQPSGQTYQILCDIGENGGDSLTAVALVANDTPAPAPASQAQPQFDDSTDAHRVLPYAQVVNSVTLDTSSKQAATGTCPDNPFVATVKDDQGNPIGGVNMDVHAKGPVDGLKFDTSSEVDDNQAPDKAGSGHTAETAWDCSGSGAATSGNAQGEHDDPNTTLDLKHIESVNDSDENGQFSFNFHDPQNSPGVTRFAVFADLDDDDKFCAGEPSATGSVTWGQGGTGNPNPPSAESCQTGGQNQGSGSTTSSGSSKTTSKTSTSSGGTNSTDTSTTKTTTTTSGGSTQTTTTTQSPNSKKVPTKLTLAFDRPVFHGAAKASDARCKRGRLVTLKKKKAGKDEVVDEDKTNKAGKWKIRTRRARGKYYAKVAKKVFTTSDGTVITCQADQSKTIRAGR
jgi:hypothetical protein